MVNQREVRTIAGIIYLSFIVVTSVLASWVLALFLLVFQQENLGRIEGELLKVVTQVTIADDRPGFCDNCTDIILEFYKGRSCKPREIAVFRRDKDGAILRIPSRFLNDHRGDMLSRPIGFNRTGWFRVEDSYTETGMHDYEIHVWHDCHAFFLTETVLWNGPLRAGNHK